MGAAGVRLARGVAVVGAAVAGLVALASPGGGATAAGAPGDTELEYVAMGDSYTSGPLVLPHDTTWVPQDCGQSIFNYPHLAAPAIGATRFVDVSCGSAKLDDLYEPQDGLPLDGVNAPQLLAVTATTDVVTLGMGGNDIGFTGLASDCIRFLGPPLEQPCTPGIIGGGDDEVAEKIAAVGPELGKALDDIHAKAPEAEVFVVGYPTAFPDNGVACWPYLPILQEDLPYLLAKYKQMNAMLAAQAAAHGATYIDVYTSSIGHDACQLPAVAWVNGAVVVPPSYPAHPNQLGLANSGGVVAAAIRQRLAAVAAQPASRAGVPPGSSTSSTEVAPAGRQRLPVTGSGDAAATLGLVLLVGAGITGRLARRRA